MLGVQIGERDNRNFVSRAEDTERHNRNTKTEGAPTLNGSGRDDTFWGDNTNDYGVNERTIQRMRRYSP